jgi:hypothetical protein
MFACLSCLFFFFPSAAAAPTTTAAAAAAGLLAVRGAEVVEVRDEEGGLMNDFTGRVRLEDRKPPKGEHTGWHGCTSLVLLCCVSVDAVSVMIQHHQNCVVLLLLLHWAGQTLRIVYNSLDSGDTFGELYYIGITSLESLLCVVCCTGFVRTYVLALDPAQYQLDVNAAAAGEAPDVYATFNVLMRRDAKENNFKVGCCCCRHVASAIYTVCYSLLRKEGFSVLLSKCWCLASWGYMPGQQQQNRHHLLYVCLG